MEENWWNCLYHYNKCYKVSFLAYHQNKYSTFSLSVKHTTIDTNDICVELWQYNKGINTAS